MGQPAITRAALLNPEEAVIAYRTGLAWRVLEAILRRRKLDSVSVRAAELTLDRYHPAPRPIVQATVHGPIILTWNDGSPSPTPLGPSSESSTTPGDGNGRGPASSSVTDSLESL